jgi:hypothetical protein
MVYIHEITPGQLEWILYAASLFVGVLPDEILLIRMRGFGRGRGSFRILRVLFVLLFTTALGPVVLVALIAFAAHAFFNSRRGR